MCSNSVKRGGLVRDTFATNQPTEKTDKTVNVQEVDFSCVKSVRRLLQMGI